jgi:hypothetical protein
VTVVFALNLDLLRVRLMRKICFRGVEAVPLGNLFPKNIAELAKARDAGSHT